MPIALKHLMQIIGVGAYIFAILVLFQFAAVQYVLASYENQPPTVTPGMSEVITQNTNLKKPTIGIPVRLKIPSIRVNAPIDLVGILPDGSMGIPTRPLNAAWYELGPKPGEIGSAVIDGHVNWWYGATGVFGKLKKLKPGDLITVQDDQGKAISFIVQIIKSYKQKDDATSIFTSNDGKAHLNLITCDGKWVKGAKAYSERLVVFADAVEDQSSTSSQAEQRR